MISNPLKIGTVISNDDISRSGQFKVSFDTQTGKNPKGEWVRYVTPFGNNKAAFVAIPLPGSVVVCAKMDVPGRSGDISKGWFYMGSVMGVIPGLNNKIDFEPDVPPVDADMGMTGDEYVEKETPGTHGMRKGDRAAVISKKERSPWPLRFRDMYDGKALVPEKIGLHGLREDTLMITNRYRGNKANDPFQQHETVLRSGSGKKLALVDSPIVDGLVYSNEHKGKNFFIWSTGNSKMSPFAAGEVHLRTHGPINTYTLESNIHTWVEEGRNIETENRATGSFAPAATVNSGGLTPTADPRHTITTSSGGYKAERKGNWGNEDWGCVKTWSHHNNVSVSAMAPDSVIHFHTTGAESKVIIDCAGTVDIIAAKKLTIQSDEEVEINAPIVDINGSNTVFIDGGPNIQLNMPHETGGAYIP
jgi:hypothetical protein